MKRFVRTALLAAFFAASLSAAAQNRSADLDKAVEEARAAYNAYQQALARRDQSVESQPGERTASAAGGSRPNEN